ncbi:hypothetical protein [Streptomyces sp. NPDC007070]
MTGHEIVLGPDGTSLREALYIASARFFQPSYPATAWQLFTGPRYNS